MHHRWCELLGFGDWAVDFPISQTTLDELADRLERSFTRVDIDGDGYISTDDLSSFMARTQHERPNDCLVMNMIKALDHEGNGTVAKEDIRRIVC